MTPILVHLPYSPWSRRAVAALAVEGVEVRLQTYLIGLGEPALRMRSGRLRGPLTIPVLLRPGQPPIVDSMAIARWASSQGRGLLFPEESEGGIAQIAALAERCLVAGRLRATARVLQDPAAMLEQVPAWMPLPRAVALETARRIGSGILRKYGHLVEGDPDTAHAQALDALQAALGERPYAVGDALSWADLAAASALGFVLPGPDVPLGPANRAAFTDEALAARHSALLARRAAVEEEVARIAGLADGSG